MASYPETPAQPLTHRPIHAHKVLSPDVMDFLEQLEQKFGADRLNLLNRRKLRQAEFDRGLLPAFLPETEHIRKADWKVAERTPQGRIEGRH